MNNWLAMGLGLAILSMLFTSGCGEPQSEQAVQENEDLEDAGNSASTSDVSDGESRSRATTDILVVEDLSEIVEGDDSKDADAQISGELDVVEEPDGFDETPEETGIALYEGTRFTLKQPARIWSLKVMLEIPPGDEQDIQLLIWDDFGGNFVSYNIDEPMAVLGKTVTQDDSGNWVEFALEKPLEIDPGRLVYAGLIIDPDKEAIPAGPFASEGVLKGETEWLSYHDGTSVGTNGYQENWTVPETSIQLHVDAEVTDPEGDIAPPSIVWSPNDPTDELGFKPIASSRDFMIEMEVEWIHSVEEHDFEEMTSEESGLPGFSRIAMEDVDNDGAVDVLLGGSGLFINQGDGTFIDDTATWFGELIPGNGMFGDYDNDGDADFFETGLEDRLFRNDGGVFVDVTAESGIDDQQDFLCDGTGGVQSVPTETASWFDANGDGWLDLYQGNFICWGDGFGSMDILWLNQGDGTFINGTADAQMVAPQEINPGNSKYLYLASRGTAPADYNGDGDMDLFVGNYRLHRNLMWDQGQEGVFTNRGQETILEGYGIKQGFITWYGHTIGAVWGDVDADGDLDVFHANLAHPRFFHFSDLATLYINEGGDAPMFTDVREEVGIRYQETPSNPNFLDYDNDGDLDLFYTCIYEARPSQFYRNDGHPAWKEVSYETGVAVLNGWGSATADIDLDGDVDLIASTGQYRNRNLSGSGSVWIRPKGSGAGATNRSGFGARVMANVDGVEVMRELAGSHGTSVQSSPFLHLGLGALDTVNVEVQFPLSGTVIEIPNVAAGSRLVVHEDGMIEEL